MSIEGQPPPPPSGLSRICSESLITVGVVLGILLIFIGQVIRVYAQTHDVLQISYVLKCLGGMFSSGALIGGGIINKNLDKFVRLGMLIAAGLVVSSMLSLVPWG